MVPLSSSWATLFATALLPFLLRLSQCTALTHLYHLCAHLILELPLLEFSLFVFEVCLNLSRSSSPSVYLLTFQLFQHPPSISHPPEIPVSSQIILPINLLLFLFSCFFALKEMKLSPTDTTSAVDLFWWPLMMPNQCVVAGLSFLLWSPHPSFCPFSSLEHLYLVILQEHQDLQSSFSPTATHFISSLSSYIFMPIFAIYVCGSMPCLQKLAILSFCYIPTSFLYKKMLGTAWASPEPLPYVLLLEEVVTDQGWGEAGTLSGSRVRTVVAPAPAGDSILQLELFSRRKQRNRCLPRHRGEKVAERWWPPRLFAT